MESRTVRIMLRVTAGLVIAFLYIPLAIVVVYAFNEARIQSWPPSGFTTKWFSVAWRNKELRSALWLSIQAALGATTIALLLGSAAAFAVHRFRFFGRQTLSFVLILPIALPGILTGIALNSAIKDGSYGKVLERWGLSEEALPESKTVTETTFGGAAK